MKIVASVALALSYVCIAFAQPPALELKELHPGMTWAEFNAKLDEVCDDRIFEDKITSCTYNSAARVPELASLANEPVGVWVFYFIGKRLGHIDADMPEKSYPAVKSALVAKFGHPTRVSTPKVSNRMGATYHQEISIWRSGDRMLQLSRYGSDLEHSAVQLTSSAYLSARIKESAKDVAGRSKDL